MSSSWFAEAWKRVRADPPRDSAAPRPRLTQAQWARLEALLHEVLERSPDERAAHLDRCCAAEPELRRELESLLAAHERAGPLDRPPIDLVEPLPAVNSAALPAPGRTVAHFEIEERVGSGGMGVVYRARDLRLGRSVALKFLPPHLSGDPAAKERLRVEAQAAAALDHPHICTILEIGETAQGQLYLAMPFYRGETLRERIERGPVPVREAVGYAIQAARALQRAHQEGVVHRDVKPANLMLCEAGVPGSVEPDANAPRTLKVLDFGIAKLADISLTGPGRAPGTVAYMSPEQASGGRVDHRTDLWSLGVVLYEMLGGRRPFRGEHEQAVLGAILRAEPEPLDTLAPELPVAVHRIVERLLSPGPEDRYASAHALALALERCLDGLAAAAPNAPTPPSTAAPGSATTGVLPQGERRQATVLVSTVSGYAELVECLPPTELEGVVEQLRQRAERIARRHGGTVHQFSGEEAVLLFGVTATHEDDSLRAVRSAMELHQSVRELSDELQQSSGRRIHLHSGIDTGPVVAHPVDGNAGLQVAGAVPQAAARLAAHAPPDEIWVSPECRRLIGAFFETQPREPLGARERRQALMPYRVVGESGIQTRLEAAERAGLTEFVGREPELESLSGCLEAAESGEGRWVVVEGEAGMGKSRLLYEFQHRLDAERWTLLRGRCQSYGAGISYLPFIEVLRDSLGLGAPDRDPDPTVRLVREIGEELEEFVPFYLHLLSMPSDRFPVPKHMHGEQFRLAMQDALAAILTLCARRRAAVLLLEDWHWADEASHAVLRQVVEMAPNYPLLVVVTSRPGSGSDWGTAASPSTIALRPLEPSASLRMLAAVTGAESVPRELGAMVHDRAGGNPFFLEEICHSLLEEGTLRVEDGRMRIRGSPAALQLPDSIHGVIRARLDRLEHDVKEVARLASVVGREFTRGVLELCLPDVGRLPNAIQVLKSAGLIQQTRVVPDAAYRFKHVLTQEVAYASLLEHQRKELHGRVGEAIERFHGTRLDEQFDRLAYHYSRAGAWVSAVRYGLRSAERASALSQFAEALRVLERVKGWISHLPEDAERRELLGTALLREERMCELLGLRGRQQRIIDRLIELYETGDDQARLAEVYVRQGDLYTLLRRFEESEAALHRSLRLRRELEDRVGERNTLRSLGMLRWHAGRHHEALECIEQAVAISQERDDPDALLGDLTNLGSVLKALGEYPRALGYLEHALALAESTRDRMSDVGAVFKQSYILHHLANVHRELGDNDRALEFLQRAVQLTTGERLPIQLSYHYTAIAHILLRQGKLEESLRHYREAVELERRAQFATGLAQSLRMLGEVLLGLGDVDEALIHLDEAATLFARLQDRETEALMWSRIAGARERGGNDTGALAAWSRARALRRQAHDTRGELEAVEGIARVTRRHVEEPSLALGHFREALELARSLDDRAAEGRISNTIGILEWTRGEYEEALACYERALGAFREAEEAEGTGLMLNSIGATLKALGRGGEAEDRLEEAVRSHRETVQPLLEGHALAILGDLRLERGDTHRAEECYERSLRIRRQVGDRRGEGWMLHHLARTQLARQLPEGARVLIDDAARIADECGDAELNAALESLRRGSAL